MTKGEGLVRRNARGNLIHFEQANPSLYYMQKAVKGKSDLGRKE